MSEATKDWLTWVLAFVLVACVGFLAYHVGTLHGRKTGYQNGARGVRRGSAAVCDGREEMKIAEIRKLLEASTPGPWVYKERECNTSSRMGYEVMAPNVAEDVDGTIICDEDYYPSAPERKEDAAFIAAMRTLAPKLLAVAEAAKKRNACEERNCYCLIGGSCPVCALDDALAALESPHD